MHSHVPALCLPAYACTHLFEIMHIMKDIWWIYIVLGPVYVKWLWILLSKFEHSTSLEEKKEK
jgi:hypothetical protein